MGFEPGGALLKVIMKHCLIYHTALITCILFTEVYRRCLLMVNVPLERKNRLIFQVRNDWSVTAMRSMPIRARSDHEPGRLLPVVQDPGVQNVPGVRKPGHGLALHGVPQKQVRHVFKYIQVGKHCLLVSSCHNLLQFKSRLPSLIQFPAAVPATLSDTFSSTSFCKNKLLV